MKTICEVRPRQNFQFRGEHFKKGIVAYIDDVTAQRWVRDGFVTIKQSHDIAKLLLNKAEPEKEN